MTTCNGSSFHQLCLMRSRNTAAIMAASVLNTPRAVEVSVIVVRTFLKLREMLATHKDLARKLDAMEQRYDAQFKVVFDAIRQLLAPPSPPKPGGKIGFGRQNEE